MGITKSGKSNINRNNISLFKNCISDNNVTSSLKNAVVPFSNLVIKISVANDSERKEMNLLDIPDEVLVSMMCFLSEKDLVAMSTTCRAMRYLATVEYVWLPRLFECWSALSLASRIHDDNWKVILHGGAKVNYPILHALTQPYPSDMEILPSVPPTS